jgi:hypothetical protein
MGLDMIEIADSGLYVEAVFRRCSTRDFNFTVSRDMTLVDVPKRPYKNPPLAIGQITFYCEDLEKLSSITNGAYFVENLFNIYEEFSVMNDLGTAPPELFMEMMHLLNDKHIRVLYGDIIYRGDNFDNTPSNVNLEKSGYTPLGTLSWKLFQVDYHRIDKQPGYLNKIRDDAKDMVMFLDSIRHLPQKQIESMVYSKFAYRNTPCEMPEEEIPG